MSDQQQQQKQAADTSPAPLGDAGLRELVKEASEIMTIVYASNFPAGIESFLVRAHAALLDAPPTAAQANAGMTPLTPFPAGHPHAAILDGLADAETCARSVRHALSIRRAYNTLLAAQARPDLCARCAEDQKPKRPHAIDCPLYLPAAVAPEAKPIGQCEFWWQRRGECRKNLDAESWCAWCLAQDAAAEGTPR